MAPNPQCLRLEDRVGVLPMPPGPKEFTAMAADSIIAEPGGTSGHHKDHTMASVLTVACATRFRSDTAEAQAALTVDHGMARRQPPEARRS